MGARGQTTALMVLVRDIQAEVHREESEVGHVSSLPITVMEE